MISKTLISETYQQPENQEADIQENVRRLARDHGQFENTKKVSMRSKPNQLFW